MKSENNLFIIIRLQIAIIFDSIGRQNGFNLMRSVGLLDVEAYNEKTQV